MPARLLSRKTLITRLCEVFREHGFDGASMAQITAATGLGKGSLYHAFPGGKDEMAAAVLADIDGWFETNVFGPLSDPSLAPEFSLNSMLDACETYFHSGRRVCLVGVFALGEARDRFPEVINGYFRRWKEAMSKALRRAGMSATKSNGLSEEILARIQGGLVLARAFNDPSCFAREIKRLRVRLQASLKE